MEGSIFLAKVFSLYLLIMGTSMAFNAAQYKAVIGEICKNTGLLFVSGVMALVVGILLICSHNLWIMDWRVIITVLAWCTFLKGVVRVAYPKLSYVGYTKMMKKKEWYWGTVGLSIFVGLYLGYMGFVAQGWMSLSY